MTVIAHESAQHLDHEAFVYATDQEYGGVLGPLLLGALAAGDETVVVVPPAQGAVLREAVNGVASLITWVDARQWYLNPARTIAGYDRILRGLDRGRSAFVIGEVQFGDDPRQWAEWTRYEAALNRVLSVHPARVICPYDLRALAPSIVDDSHRTHPMVLDTVGAAPSGVYTEPERLIPALPLAPVRPGVAPTLELNPVASVREARREFEAIAAASGFHADRVDDLVVAISEVVTNGLVHGRAPVRLEVWCQPGHILCVVEDSGRGQVDPLAGFRTPDDTSAGGRGLFFTRQVFDHVELALSASGGLSVHLTATV